MAGLLAHCAKARSARPSARWQKACRQRLDAVADASALLCALLDLVVTTEPITFLGASWRRPVLIGYNERLVRGLVWAVGVLDPDWLAQALPEVAVRCLQLGRGRGYPPKPVRGTKIPFPCFRALGQSGSESSLRALVQLGQATRHRRLLQKRTRPSRRPAHATPCPRRAVLRLHSISAAHTTGCYARHPRRTRHQQAALNRRSARVAWAFVSR